MNVPDIANQLERIETLLAELIQQKFQKEWYSTADLAELTGRAEFTVREWCRLGRITAVKEAYGRKREWRISHEEVQRILNHGPRPLFSGN
ncbi:Helix-turn-helix domain protein [Gimesia algae]|uniref:Helix-turn-helix domain protein n=2 Tax=Gimesia algae TaxID=2527971 RepID=A0A517VEK2_9PLAN|nr:Helix-turn-helix domain protein [Gimesia algae]